MTKTVTMLAFWKLTERERETERERRETDGGERGREGRKRGSGS